MEFGHEEQTHRVVVHFDADPADMAALLHTVCNITPGSLVVGVHHGGAVLPLGVLCDNPPLYRGQRLELVVKEPVAKRSGMASPLSYVSVRV